MKRSLFFVLALVGLLWLTGCRCTNNDVQYQHPPTNGGITGETPPEPQEQTKDFDLTTAKRTEKDCVLVYDFNFCAGTFPVYGLAAEYKGQVVVLLKTECKITNLVWSEDMYSKCKATNAPSGLKMNIDAPGQEYWYTVPKDATQVGYLTVTFIEE